MARKTKAEKARDLEDAFYSADWGSAYRKEQEAREQATSAPLRRRTLDSAPRTTDESLSLEEAHARGYIDDATYNSVKQTQAVSAMTEANRRRTGDAFGRDAERIASDKLDEAIEEERLNMDALAKK